MKSLIFLIAIVSSRIAVAKVYNERIVTCSTNIESKLHLVGLFTDKMFLGLHRVDGKFRPYLRVQSSVEANFQTRFPYADESKYINYTITNMLSSDNHYLNDKIELYISDEYSFQGSVQFSFLELAELYYGVSAKLEATAKYSLTDEENNKYYLGTYKLLCQ